MLLVREEAEGRDCEGRHLLFGSSVGFSGLRGEKQRELSFDSAQVDDVLFITRSLKNGELAKNTLNLNSSTYYCSSKASWKWILLCHGLHCDQGNILWILMTWCLVP